MPSIAQGGSARPPASGKGQFPPPLAQELQPKFHTPPPLPALAGGEGTERSHTARPCPPGCCPQPTHSHSKAAELSSHGSSPRCSPLGNPLQPSPYAAEAFASRVRAISGSRNQHLQAAKPHRTVFNRNFIDIEDLRRTLMNT